LRGALVFAVIPFASTIQGRISSGFIFEPTTSNAPFELPLPAIEWHSEHFCAAYTCSPFAFASWAEAAVAAPTAINTPHTTLRNIAYLPAARLEQAGCHSEFRQIRADHGPSRSGAREIFRGGAENPA